MTTLPIHIDDATAAHWQRFQTAVTDMGLSLPPQHPALNALKTGFALSRFVAQTVLRRPEIAVDLIESGDLMNPYGDGDRLQRYQTHMVIDSGGNINADVRKIWATMGKTQFERLLRLFRHREMLRIAVRDLAGLADLQAVLEDLTTLADQCLQQALAFLYHRQCLEWGTPVDGDGNPQELIVLGMGKLGAHELNFSSDVDLIFTYAKEGQTINGTKSTSNEDFFLRLCRSLIQTIGANTAEGFVFRVDTLLRPFGESGPLVLSFSRMEDYYETHGREWERYALIKARVVAGDTKVGQQLLDNLKPFIFRRYLDYNTFESLRDMKKRIAFEVRTKGLENNVKLGPGGIREIEFFGQMFQLLRGGVQPELQARPILTILQRLVEHHYIPPETQHDLTSAYIFLRRTENRIQAYLDQQRHNLPQTADEQRLLSSAMAFDDWPSFLRALNHHRKKVQYHFNALLAHGDAQTTPPEEERVKDGIKAIWQGATEQEQAHEILKALRFTKSDTVLKLIQDLKDDAALRFMSTMGQERLTRILPLLVTVASQSAHPQLVLGRLFNLIKSICRRTSYLSLLCEYPEVITHLVQLFESSPWIADQLCRHPVLLDELLDPRTLYNPPKKEELVAELHSLLTGIPKDDLEHQLESMRIFKQTNTLRVAASDITNVLPLMKVSDRLSDIAEVVLNKVVDISWRHLMNKHGAPTCQLNEQPCSQGFAVIAYGKLGGLELGYRSDLDLVFLHAAAPGQTREGPRPIDNAQFFARLGQRVLHILSAHTSAGILYETDMRLRPSGDSGMLVSHIDGFKNYHLNDAWTWEHQALIRARAIAGDEAIQKQFEQIRMEVLAQPRDSQKLRHEVTNMRERLRQAQSPTPNRDNTFEIKQGHGGIVDIEFIVQYLILCHAHRHREITRWTDNVRQLQALSSHGIIDQPSAFGLRRAYLILRAMGHRLNLKELPAHIDDSRFKGLRAHVKRCWRAFLEE
jgi:[glutamine synthetase] adenylyltransferase / [glutamine synthetase]-adenylyl-L-tyrosine phosphorylase